MRHIFHHAEGILSFKWSISAQNTLEWGQNKKNIHAQAISRDYSPKTSLNA